MVTMLNFVRASVNGIVYLINSTNGQVYTYNLDNPVYIGKLENIPGEELNTAEGTLTGAKLVLRNDWKEVMAKLV
jgi:hypothetical protein